MFSRLFMFLFLRISTFSFTFFHYVSLHYFPFIPETPLFLYFKMLFASVFTSNLFLFPPLFWCILFPPFLGFSSHSECKTEQACSIYKSVERTLWRHITHSKSMISPPTKKTKWRWTGSKKWQKEKLNKKPLHLWSKDPSLVHKGNPSGAWRRR